MSGDFIVILSHFNNQIRVDAYRISLRDIFGFPIARQLLLIMYPCSRIVPELCIYEEMIGFSTAEKRDRREGSSEYIFLNSMED